MIGMFDSGIGGLSILLEVRRLLPDADIVYYGDNAHFPYGERTSKEIIEFSSTITQMLKSMGAAMIVVACNTATVAAIEHLRRRFDLPFVGVEPAVKPASVNSNEAVAILLTQTTSEGKKYRDLLKRFADDRMVYTHCTAGLAKLVEKGEVNGDVARDILKRILDPIFSQGVENLVLGCTHYHFLTPLIRELAPYDIRIFSPAEAVAKQAVRVYNSLKIPPESNGKLQFICSGDKEAFKRAASAVTGINIFNI